MSSTFYDAIVIGSGIGGLTTASLLAQLGKKKVLVVERHYKLGGFLHSFRRKDYEWDPGVHYIGEMQPGSMSRNIMDLVTRKGVEWHRLSSPFERFIFPEGSFDVPDDPKLYQAQLIKRFPAEAEKITRYFKDMARAQSWVTRWFVSKQYGPRIANMMMYLGKRLPGMTTGDYLARFDDPLLRAILAAQWPDFGTPPAESAFGMHATVAADFLNGGFFPVGGGKEIAKHAAAAITDHGGECLINHEVQQIDVRHGRAYGITALHKGREVQFRAPLIISNAGAVNTFEKMVPSEYCSAEREKIARLKPGPSANILFLGLNDDPRKHGFGEYNYWIYRSLNHDVKPSYNNGHLDRIDGAFVSFCSLRNPGQTPHTAQIVTFDQENSWSAFGDSPWKRRGDEYEQQKEQFADSLLNYAETYLPGFRKLVDYQELSTPLSVKTFTDHRGGTVYGQACDANRLFRDRWMIGTSVRHLYLTGSDVGLPGVNGAMMAGVMTAGKLLGMFGLGQIMHAAYSR